MSRSLVIVTGFVFLVNDLGSLAWTAVPACLRDSSAAGEDGWRPAEQEVPPVPEARAGSATHQLALHRKPDEIRGLDSAFTAEECRMSGSPVAPPLVSADLIRLSTGPLSGRNAPLRL